MATVMIADFSGMLPLRDDLVLPDNNAQYADNCWLYRGQVRGFREQAYIYTAQYSDTQSVYRIPIDPTAPPDFTLSGSYWLEFPDPYMTVIRNPVVGDTAQRYYFFPSDQYRKLDPVSNPHPNPLWPTTSPGPMYTTLFDIQHGNPYVNLGVPIPTGGPPTVTPPALKVVLNPSAASAVGSKTLTFTSTTDGSGNPVRVGMLASDLTDITVKVNTTSVSNAGTTKLFFTNTSNIQVGMSVKNNTNPASVFPNSSVASIVVNTSVTINFDLSDNVSIGDQIQFDSINQIPANTKVTAVTSTTVTLDTAIVSAGVAIGDTIEFDTDVIETRAYLYTYVTSHAEEGPPSPATVASGDTTGTWQIVIPAVPPADGVSSGPLVHFRLYRTVTDSNGNATYHQVAEVPINWLGTTTITDSALTTDIVGNLQLSTLGYTPPPNGFNTAGKYIGVQGVVMMANGIAAGFAGDDSREVWFSAAYLPHAWPGAYALTVDYPIVGMTANGTSLNIITEGSPFIATGVTPDTMTIGKITSNEPCIGRGSICASGEGAYYASPNGIQLVNTGGTTNITDGIYEKEFHYSLLPQNWAAGKYGQTYAVFVKGTPAPGPDGNPDHGGFVIDHTDANVPFSYMHFPINVRNLYFDELSGQLFTLMANGTVMQWNPPPNIPNTTTLLPWEWKTKKFRFTFPQLFKAFLVLYDVPPEVTITLGVRNNDQSQVFNPAVQYLIVRVYADGREVVVREVQASGEVLLIPGGYKAELWEFQFEGEIALKFFKCATSVHELKAA